MRFEVSESEALCGRNPSDPGKINEHENQPDGFPACALGQQRHNLTMKIESASERPKGEGKEKGILRSEVLAERKKSQAHRQGTLCIYPIRK